MIASVHLPGIELLDELGRGAYSIVYRGRRSDTPCAVKIPRVRGRWTKWVHREAVALARVHHAALPKVLEVGEADDLPFLAMELIEGETLADRLARRPLEETEALSLVQQLVSALSAIHDAGLVHRDVKPRNIILKPDGSIRLVDFGFASPIERMHEGESAAGTPGYAAPEQLRPPFHVDGRSDLYAVGRVFDECLTGHPQRPVRLSLVGSDAVTAPPAALGRIVEGLSFVSPADRYPDARAVLGEIDRLRAGRELLGPSGYSPGHRPAPLVGREIELQRLTRAWAGVGVGRGAVMLLRGSRGSGKSRLLAAFRAKVNEAGGRRVLEARCREGDPPLAALRGILEAYLESLHRGSPDERAAGEHSLRAAAADHLAPFARLIAPKVSGVLGSGSGPEAAAGDFAEGAAELLVRLARNEGPLAIFVDDYHWIDPVSRDALLRLAHRADTAPLLLVLCARDTPGVGGIERILAMDRPVVWVQDLLPFQPAGVAALVASHLGVDTVDPAMVRRVVGLADETPLGVLEVLGALLDAGAVRPLLGAWQFDVERAERVELPRAALSLLGRRLGDVPAATRAVLEAAAVVGASFRDDLLASVVGLSLDDVGFALADARRAGLLEAEPPSGHRFLHDSLRETLLASLAAQWRQDLHQRVAEALDDGAAVSFERLCAIATHYARGSIARAPNRVYRAARAAADAALGRFDNETVLRFLELARKAAESAGLDLDTTFHRTLAEAQLRLGAIAESLRAFEAALPGTSDPRACADLHGRIAWVHSCAADPDLAWASLGRAFAAIGGHMPMETASSAARSAATLTAAAVRSFSGDGSLLDGKARIEAEILCQLHYQNVRLGIEYGKPLRLLTSALEARITSERLGAGRARARAAAIYGLVLSLLGRRVAGGAERETARAMATALADPITAAFCAQIEAVAAGMTGDLDRSLAFSRSCLEEHGPWLELNEYCYNAATGELIETVRGRSSEAWAWIASAVSRLRRSHPAAPVFAEYLVHRASAALASVGKTLEDDAWLSKQVEILARDEVPRTGFYHLLSWGPRVRLLLERGDVGPAFEELVTAFQREGHKPRFAHVAVVEYYIAVAHGRLEQCLRALPADRPGHTAKLRAALADLRAAARMPLVKAHSLYIAGCLAWLEGSLGKSERLFAKAEALATQETCPWVLYAIARVRAHILRDRGKLPAARDQARIAEALAEEHGAEPRSKAIRQEFALPSRPPPARPTSRSSRSSRSGAAGHARQQLAALLHVIRAPVSDLSPEHQIPAVVDDLVRTLDAERGLLWFQPEPDEGPRILVGRTRAKQGWSPGDGWWDPLLRSVREAGEVWPPAADVAEIVPSPAVPEGVDVARVIAIPLFLNQRAVGAVCLERLAGAPAFTIEERDLFVVLSYQVPISIELARLLAEREQLQSSLQQAQKMEAIGQLASSVAHDFANMLQAVRGSVGHIAQCVGDIGEITEELEVISTATDRAGRLMRQLLGFSQHQRVARAPTSINDVISEITPMLERLVGHSISLVLDLDPEAETVAVDRGSFEQVLVNLVLNARDAMPSGGLVRIQTRNAVLDENTVRRGAPAGDYVVLRVEDTGQGIPLDVLPRIFDPFYTTKPPGGGSGVGLTTAYAFMKSSRGDIQVSSEVGRGTTFHLYFPKADIAPAAEAKHDGALDASLTETSPVRKRRAR